jgi:hypothetical protein
MAIATANGSPMQILRKALQLMSSEDEERSRPKNPGSPTYELLLISVGFLAGVLVGMSMTGH